MIFMSSPNTPALQKLHRLKGSSPDFYDQLSDVLYGEEYQQCVPILQGDDLVWLVDYLDKALDGLDPSSATSRKCLRELRSICGTRAILPITYTLSSRLLTIGPEPFASGGYGDVYEGTLDGSRICVKRMRVYIRDGPKKATKTFCREAVIWKHLTHPNILPLLGITITPLQLVSDWMSGGDLPEYIKKHSNTDRLGLLSDIAKGLCYLHSCNVIHGDLKGPNILVDNSGNARIADFGLATVTQSLESVHSTSRQQGHTPRWTAPEVLSGGAHSKEADIFSFAMVMIEVFTGAIPFGGDSSFAAMLAVTQGRRPSRPTHPTFTENLWTLIQRCWSHNPHLRPEVSEALQVILTPEDLAWKQLISPTFTTDGRVSLITTIFLDHNQVEMVEHLSGDDAQTFIDITDEALNSLPPEIRIKCLHYLYRICGRQTLLPRSLSIPLCYNPTEYPLCHGGSADVWKGQYHDREVAAKVLRLYPKDDFRQIKRRFCREVAAWKNLHHPNVLPLLGVTITENRLVMVSEWMVNGNIKEFAKAGVNTDRLGFLRGVSKGLIYMHDQGIIHGGLKGTNILIDSNGCARLAGFSLLTITSDQSTITSSATLGGTPRWMSPELFDPGRFGLKESCPTKESDCYALGMVIYEVLSGQQPYASCKEVAVIFKVLDGERPKRPRGEGGAPFTDDIWGMLELCWKPQPSDRISAKAILLVLEGNPSPFQPPSNVDGNSGTDIYDQLDVTKSGSRLPIACGDNRIPDLPQTGNQKERWIGGRFARGARKMSEATVRKLYGL